MSKAATDGPTPPEPTLAERLEAARAFVSKLLAEELKKAEHAECLADLDRAAGHARIDRAIERGEEEPLATGWSWAKGRREHDDKYERAAKHLALVSDAVALATAGMTSTIASLVLARPQLEAVESEPTGGGSSDAPNPDEE